MPVAMAARGQGGSLTKAEVHSLVSSVGRLVANGGQSRGMHAGSAVLQPTQPAADSAVQRLGR